MVSLAVAIYIGIEDREGETEREEKRETERRECERMRGERESQKEKRREGGGREREREPERGEREKATFYGSQQCNGEQGPSFPFQGFVSQSRKMVYVLSYMQKCSFGSTKCCITCSRFF